MSSFFSLGLLGKNIQHSLSPLMQMHWLKSYGISGEYHLYDLEEIDKNLPILKGLYGLNVTAPYKEHLFTLLFPKDPIRLKVLNVLYKTPQGDFTYANTDTLAAQDIFRDIKAEERILILGNGGTARTLVDVFYQKGLNSIFVVGRQEKPWYIDYQERITPVLWENLDFCIENANRIINTVPKSPFQGKKLRKDHMIYDYCYGDPSLFHMQARSMKCEMIGGLEFLILQGQYSFLHWFGVFPHVSLHLRKQLEKRIGMR